MLVILFFERMCRFIALLNRTFITVARVATVSGFRLSMQLRGNDFMETFNIKVISGGSRIFQMGGRCFVTNGGAHILFSGKKCMKLKEIGLKWGAHVF